MAKPVVEIQITTLDEKTAAVQGGLRRAPSTRSCALTRFPPGCRHPAIRASSLPDGGPGGFPARHGELPVVMTIGDREVDDVVMVAPELSQELIVGRGTMQKWDISVVTKEGRTAVHVGRHMHDPDVTEVD